MLKIVILFQMVLLWSFNVKSQTNYQWTAQITGPSSTGTEEIMSITLDSSGNVYATGYYEGTVDFDPGPGTFNMTSAGMSDIFVIKLNPSGSMIWAKSFGGIWQELMDVSSIVLDSYGQIYITGKYSAPSDFDPGPGVYTLAGSSSDFLAKLNTSGDLIWAKGFGASGGSRTLCLDKLGYIYVAGDLIGTGDFDPGLGTFNLSSLSTGYDIFIAKFDTTGNFIWAKQVAGMGEEHPFSLIADSVGNVYVSGILMGTCDFDPGLGTYNLTSPPGIYNPCVFKLDSVGDFLWAGIIAGPSNGESRCIRFDQAGDIYLSGWFIGRMDFDMGPDSTFITSNGGLDGFISKMDVSGNLIWAKNIGGASTDLATTLDIDALNNIYVSGRFSGTVDFNPGSGIYNLSSSCGMFVLKLDSSQVFQWAVTTQGSGCVNSYSVAVDENSNVYTAGGFGLVVDFNPGVPVDNYLGVYNDGFVMKLSQGITTDVFEKNNIESNMKLYPIPVSESLIAEVTSTGELNIRIYNATGQLIKSIISPSSTNQVNEISIDVSSLIEGLYFIQIDGKDFNRAKCFVVGR